MMGLALSKDVDAAKARIAELEKELLEERARACDAADAATADRQAIEAAARNAESRARTAEAAGKDLDGKLTAALAENAKLRAEHLAHRVRIEKAVVENEQRHQNELGAVRTSLELAMQTHAAETTQHAATREQRDAHANEAAAFSGRVSSLTNELTAERNRAETLAAQFPKVRAQADAECKALRDALDKVRGA